MPSSRSRRRQSLLRAIVSRARRPLLPSAESKAAKSPTAAAVDAASSRVPPPRALYGRACYTSQLPARATQTMTTKNLANLLKEGRRQTNITSVLEK